MNFRCLRAANRGLYLGATLLVLGAVAFVLWQGGRPEWQQWLAAAAALITLIWGGYYALLRYQVDALGVSYHSFFMTRARILWEELDGVDVAQEEGNGIARCTITLRAKDGRTLTLSSDQLALDEVEGVAADLRQQGFLPPAPSAQDEEAI